MDIQKWYPVFRTITGPESLRGAIATKQSLASLHQIEDCFVAKYTPRKDVSYLGDNHFFSGDKIGTAI